LVEKTRKVQQLVDWQKPLVQEPKYYGLHRNKRHGRPHPPSWLLAGRRLMMLYIHIRV
jgi:hypothetical protein